MKRYQDCNWLEKLWRRRWQLLVPYWTIASWLSSDWYKGWDGLLIAWDVSVGQSHIQMNWVYSLEEVEGFLNEKLEEISDGNKK